MKKVFNFVLGLCLFGGIYGSAFSMFKKGTIEASWVFLRPAEISHRSGTTVIPAGALVVASGAVADKKIMVYELPYGSQTVSQVLLGSPEGLHITRCFLNGITLERFSYVIPSPSVK